MTESFRNEETAAEHERLFVGGVSVPFRDESRSIILETATPELDSFDTSFGPIEYIKYILADGTVLSSSDLSRVGRFTDFIQSLEVYQHSTTEPLLTRVGDPKGVGHNENVAFLKIVKNLAGVAEHAYVHDLLFEKEERELAKLIDTQASFLDNNNNPDIWLRLDPTEASGEHLRGQVLMARLAAFDMKMSEMAIRPLIFSAHNDGVHYRIPEHLTINRQWSYGEIDMDDGWI